MTSPAPKAQARAGLALASIGGAKARSAQTLDVRGALGRLSGKVSPSSAVSDRVGVAFQPSALRRFAVSFAFGFLALGASSCAKKLDESVPLRWNDFASGRSQALREGKGVVIFFYANWSLADVRLDQEVFPSEDVRLAMRGEIVPARVDLSDIFDASADPLRERYQVTGVPTVLVVDPTDDAVLVRHEEYVSATVLAASIGRANAVRHARADRRGVGASSR